MTTTPTMPGVYALASHAGTYSPDRDDSPGADFLRSVAEDAAELWQDHAGDYPDDPGACLHLTDDRAHEIADGAVPVYTATLWATFVDLGAYMEDASDYGDPDGHNMTALAGWCLYGIARRLVDALITEWSGEYVPADDDADDDQ